MIDKDRECHIQGVLLIARSILVLVLIFSVAVEVGWAWEREYRSIPELVVCLAGSCLSIWLVLLFIRRLMTPLPPPNKE